MSDNEKNETENDDKTSHENQAMELGKSLDSLKKLSPKTLIAIAVGVLVLGWLVFSPSGDLGTHKKIEAQKGQSYVITNPNGSTVKLTKAPGVSGGMTDDAESKGIDDSVVCLIKDSPHGIVKNMGAGNLGLRYVKVEITEGACNGKSGWVSAINLSE